MHLVKAYLDIIIKTEHQQILKIFLVGSILCKMADRVAHNFM